MLVCLEHLELVSATRFLAHSAKGNASRVSLHACVGVLVVEDGENSVWQWSCTSSPPNALGSWTWLQGLW